MDFHLSQPNKRLSKKITNNKYMLYESKEETTLWSSMTEELTAELV